jgi:hypothetical protein
VSVVCALKGHKIRWIAAMQMRQCLRCRQAFPSPQRHIPAKRGDKK